jgi:hypothetical protein
MVTVIAGNRKEFILKDSVGHIQNIGCLISIYLSGESPHFPKWIKGELTSLILFFLQISPMHLAR